MKKIILLTSILVIAGSAFAQRGNSSYWNPIPESEIQNPGERTIIPEKYKTYHLTETALKNKLFSAPKEDNVSLRNSPVVIDLPLPDGSVQKFRVVEAPIMAPELAAQHPDIKTFNVEGIDDPRANGKIDWTVFGFHGMIRKPSGDVFIDPYGRNTTSDYITYYTTDFKKDPKDVLPEVGVIDDHQKKNVGGGERSALATICSGTKLRTYRLALACTGEYAKAATGKASPTPAEILAVVTTSINRVDGIYETEVAVRLVLIANESAILFGDPATDSFNGNNNAQTLIGESQSVITSKIGTANFDIGHTFSTGGGGLANLGCICTSNTKASGITGSSKPVGDPYDVDYVAHEMGHQFGGNHTFASATGSCSGNGSSVTRVEPGSGITIMAYAGICQANDIAPHSIAYFHTISFDEIMAYSNTGSGNSCPTTVTTTNHPPVVTVSSTFNIPFSTPFTLTGSATDQDGDSLTYSWEEFDSGSQGDWNSGNKPFFRSYNPVISPSRTFPLPSIVLAGPSAYKTTKGEYLPSNAQTLNFRLTARDNKMAGGGVCYAASKVVIASAGPFAVTYPNTTGITWPGGSTQTVTWDVKGTDASPISCANVNILCSIDGGITFTTVLANTPNDGTQAITVPQVPSTKTTCRIKVEAAGNIFFDISDQNFTITSTVGINELASVNTLGVQLVPNPAQDQVLVSVYGLNKNLTTRLTIYDILGNIIMNDQFSGKDQINQNYTLASLSKGVYILEIRNEEQKAISRLVKQ